MWYKADNGETIGTIGSEGGIIINDEEYSEICRITLEKCSRYFAITCGIYGAMVHTVFGDEDNIYSTYNRMKQDLQVFIDTDTTEDEKLKFYSEFTNKY